MGNLGEVGIVDGDGAVPGESGKHVKYGSMAPGQGLEESWDQDILIRK